MTVFIHPTAANPNCIAELQRETGMRAVIGKTFGVLIHKNGKAPAMRSTNTVLRSSTNHGPFDGGGRAA